MPLVLFHSVEHLGTPFSMVDEYLFYATDKGNAIDNKIRKIIFILEGTCRHEIYDGTRRISSVRLSPGDVFVLPYACQHLYRTEAGKTPVRVHAMRLVFDPTLLPPLFIGGSHSSNSGDGSGDPETSFDAFAQHHLQTFRHFPGAMAGEIETVVRDLQREAEARLPGYRLRIHGLCVGLTTLVARRYAFPSGGKHDNGTGSLDGTSAAVLAQSTVQVPQVRRFVHDHLPEDLPLCRIASHIGVSEEHLARVFKKTTGQTLGEFIRQTRLERAKGLLVGTDYSVGKVAETTGFTSLALFSRSFRTYTGVSPSDYRQRLLGGLR